MFSLIFDERHSVPRDAFVHQWMADENFDDQPWWGPRFPIKVEANGELLFTAPYHRPRADAVGWCVGPLLGAAHVFQFGAMEAWVRGRSYGGPSDEPCVEWIDMRRDGDTAILAVRPGNELRTSFAWLFMEAAAFAERVRVFMLAHNPDLINDWQWGPWFRREIPFLNYEDFDVVL